MIHDRICLYEFIRGKKLFTAINKTEQHIVDEGTTTFILSWSNNLPDKTTRMEK